MALRGLLAIWVFYLSLFQSQELFAMNSDSNPFQPLAIENSGASKKSSALRTLEPTLIFDIPITYNGQVQFWIKYFQTTGRKWFRTWLERSYRYLPFIQATLRAQNLPLDLAYMAMIESGFSLHAVSSANAVGPWQFTHQTGIRYGLKTAWWLDERRDLEKSTRAATRYIKDLHTIFNSWYLVGASYNMGENGVKRIIERHNTRDFWALVRKGAFSDETQNYIPKLMAAILIAKAPGLYGFRELQKLSPLDYETFIAPGGTDLSDLANHLGVTTQCLADLNPELTKKMIPANIRSHEIRVPKRSSRQVSEYFRSKLEAEYRASQRSSPLL